MDIQWYPGHMAKAKRLLIEKLKVINVAAIIVDARAPLSTFNPELYGMLEGKECLLVLNKEDLADEGTTRRWTECFREKYGNALSFDALRGKRNALLGAIKNRCRSRRRTVRREGHEEDSARAGLRHPQYRKIRGYKPAGRTQQRKSGRQTGRDKRAAVGEALGYA